MVEGNEQLTQLMNAVQDAAQTIQQAEASGNIQQMYEAQRVLYLAQQRLAHVQTELGATDPSEDGQQQLQRVQQHLVDGEYAEPQTDLD